MTKIPLASSCASRVSMRLMRVFLSLVHICVAQVVHKGVPIAFFELKKWYMKCFKNWRFTSIGCSGTLSGWIRKKAKTGCQTRNIGDSLLERHRWVIY